MMDSSDEDSDDERLFFDLSNEDLARLRRALADADRLQRSGEVEAAQRCLGTEFLSTYTQRARSRDDAGSNDAPAPAPPPQTPPARWERCPSVHPPRTPTPPRSTLPFRARPGRNGRNRGDHPRTFETLPRGPKTALPTAPPGATASPAAAAARAGCSAGSGYKLSYL